ncbi:hypothetical protein JHK82_035974 [Glycine max]|nr:hypothetical protein JHK82_035974 [Glycine max]
MQNITMYGDGSQKSIITGSKNYRDGVRAFLTASFGPGASTNARIKWPGYRVINKDEATQFTVGSFMKGTWIQNTGVPSTQGLYN